MIFAIPSNTLTRLEAIIENASDPDGRPPLIIQFIIRHGDGSEPSANEVNEIHAVLDGYAADGPLDGVEAGSILR